MRRNGRGVARSVPGQNEKGLTKKPPKADIQSALRALAAWAPVRRVFRRRLTDVFLHSYALSSYEASGLFFRQRIPAIFEHGAGAHLVQALDGCGRAGPRIVGARLLHHHVVRGSVE